ncbi:leucyl/phenylalanyl-tRNA--protein transferase [Alteromonadaceae bacterium BrNp21-10]|nr:leucyl/phenylalanyl-tRNA--protein transferase [Alteromonadaceae bacterium BrNp21-10]
MPKRLAYLDQQITFPKIEHALDEPNGLLAIGGNLSVERLRKAYQQGIFPWFSDNEPIMWWSPAPRAIINLDNIHFSKSLKKFVRNCGLTVTLNKNFAEIIHACATIPREDNGTWITEDMQQAYINMHQLGFAHSIEVWQHQQLVGGLYGVVTGRMFCGESMFHRLTNTSKLAMYYLITHLKNNDFEFIDCQMMTAHLKSLGAISISRADFKRRLRLAHQDLPQQALPHKMWAPQTLSP